MVFPWPNQFQKLKSYNFKYDVVLEVNYAGKQTFTQHVVLNFNKDRSKEILQRMAYNIDKIKNFRSQLNVIDDGTE